MFDVHEFGESCRLHVHHAPADTDLISATFGPFSFCGAGLGPNKTPDRNFQLPSFSADTNLRRLGPMMKSLSWDISESDGSGRRPDQY